MKTRISRLISLTTFAGGHNAMLIRTLSLRWQ